MAQIIEADQVEFDRPITEFQQLPAFRIVKELNKEELQQLSSKVKLKAVWPDNSIIVAQPNITADGEDVQDMKLCNSRYFAWNHLLILKDGTHYFCKIGPDSPSNALETPIETLIKHLQGLPPGTTYYSHKHWTHDTPETTTQGATYTLTLRIVDGYSPPRW